MESIEDAVKADEELPSADGIKVEKAFELLKSRPSPPAYFRALPTKVDSWFAPSAPER
jgi:hypothetical protein